MEIVNFILIMVVFIILIIYRVELDELEKRK